MTPEICLIAMKRGSAICTSGIQTAPILAAASAGRGRRLHQVGSGKSNAGCAEVPATVDGRGQGEAMAILCPVPAMEHGPRSFVTKGVSGSGSAIVEVRAKAQLLGR